MAHEPTLYSDANIYAAMHTPPLHTLLSARRIRTEEWWQLERKFFAMFASKRVELELSSGVFRAQEAALAAVKRVPYLHPNALVSKLIQDCFDRNIIPTAEYADAFHLAITTVHRVDYLLTWNHAHLSNPETIKKLKTFDQEKGTRSPLIVSPDSIPWVSMGQSIRRRNE